MAENSCQNLSVQPIETLVQQVLFAVASACCRQRDQAPVLTVFSGATAGLTQALSGLEHLMLNGVALDVLVSESAGRLYGDVIEKRLMAWPGARAFDPSDWFSKVQRCSGIIIPLLSVATLSRICTLAPSSLADNIIVQALFMGKPVVAAIDGADPTSPDRAALGLNRGTPALTRALAGRFIEFSDFGARLTRACDLGRAGLRALAPSGERPVAGPSATQRTALVDRASGAAKPAPFSGSPRVRLVDAGLVKQARHTETIIRCAPGAVVTPLARELASGWGIEIRLDA